MEAARLRLRPILMTSIAFIAGVMPLALAHGAGAGSQNDIGTGVMGGMITATVLAIFFVPVFFQLINTRPAASQVAPSGRLPAGGGTDHTPGKIWEWIMIRFCAVAALALLASPAFADDIPARDHTVTVISTVPAIAGQKSTLYVRERALPKVLRHGAGDKVVLFVHGAGTPAEVSFDVPYQDYSWMGYLAAAGYDVFSVDMTGYGRSARPAPMSDKCNLSPEQQKGFGVNCPQSYPGNLTNIGSDWNDISAAVAFIKKLRHVKKLNLVGWSQGGPRAGGWTADHPDQVAKLILWRPPTTATSRQTRHRCRCRGLCSTPRAMTNSSPTGTARRPAPASMIRPPPRRCGRKC